MFSTAPSGYIEMSPKPHAAMVCKYNRRAPAIEVELMQRRAKSTWQREEQWRRHGGQAGQLVPPTSDRTPREIDADPGRFSCRKKMGVGLQDLLPGFTCTDGTENVLWSYDYETRGVVKAVEEVTLVRPQWSSDNLWYLSVLALALPSMIFAHSFFVFIFKCEFGAPPKYSGPKSNPIFSFWRG